jgi:hypothetical protein
VTLVFISFSWSSQVLSNAAQTLIAACEQGAVTSTFAHCFHHATRHAAPKWCKSLAV